MNFMSEGQGLKMHDLRSNIPNFGSKIAHFCKNLLSRQSILYYDILCRLNKTTILNMLGPSQALHVGLKLKAVALSMIRISS